METVKTNATNEALKNGLGLGLCMLFLTILSTYIIVGTDSLLTLTLAPIIISIIIPIVISIFFTKDLRKKVGGYWTFKEAVSKIFIMFLISFAISTAGNVVYSKYISPGLQERLQDNIEGLTSTMMLDQGMESDVVDTQIQKMRDDFDKRNNGTFMQQAQGYLIAIIFVFIISLIFAGIFKKNPPLFVNED